VLLKSDLNVAQTHLKNIWVWPKLHTVKGQLNLGKHFYLWFWSNLVMLLMSDLALQQGGLSPIALVTLCCAFWAWPWPWSLRPLLIWVAPKVPAKLEPVFNKQRLVCWANAHSLLLLQAFPNSWLSGIWIWSHFAVLLVWLGCGTNEPLASD